MKYYSTFLTAISFIFSFSFTQNSRWMSVRFVMVTSCKVIVPFEGMIMVPTVDFFSSPLGNVSPPLIMDCKQDLVASDLS